MTFAATTPTWNVERYARVGVGLHRRYSACQ